MDYTKFILQREGIDLGEAKTFVDIYELLTNQQDLQKIGKKILSTLTLTGDVSLVRFHDNRFYIVEAMGKNEEILKAFDDKSLLREVRIHKKMYHAQEDVLTKPYYMILPILSKNDEFLGALCIHTKQDISCWKELHVLLNLMSFVFKYYDMIDSNKFFNIKDSVTNLYNFRHFQNLLDIEIEKTTRYNIPLSLVVINIENFKTMNDKLGFDGGDEVLFQLGDWIQSNSRKIDMPARIEADTFAVLLSNTPVEGAQVYLDRLLVKISNKKMNVKEKEFKIRVHASIAGYSIQQTRQEFLDAALSGLKKKDS